MSIRGIDDQPKKAMKTRIVGLVLTTCTVIALSGVHSSQAGSFSSDFNGGVPTGSSTFGSAIVADGALKLTTTATFQTGSLIVDDLDAGEFVKAFTATFQLKIGGGSGADGFSFVFGPLIPNAPIAHEGSNDRGLVISFDTRDNGGGEAPSIDVFRGGYLVGSYKTDVLALLRTNAFQPVSIAVDAEGRLSLTVGSTPVFTQLRGAFVPSYGRFGLGAYCGNLTDHHWVDDLRSRPPQPPSVTYLLWTWKCSTLAAAAAYPQ
jgi:hypothetical protein